MRSYGDACGITRALDLVGERWALPVVRELVFGPRRYSDLAAALPGISTNILGTRLRGLTSAGIVRGRRLPPPAAAAVYELTPRGAALEPVLTALGTWGARTPVDLASQAFSPASFALSLKTAFDADAAHGVAVRARIAMGTDAFAARVAEGGFAIQRDPGAPGPPGAPADPADVHIAAEPAVLAAAAYGPGAAVEQPGVRIEGSPASAAAFFSCFALPDPFEEGPP